MKKILLFSLLLVSAQFLLAQTTCETALTPNAGTNNIPATAESFYWYTFSTGADPAKVTIDAAGASFIRLSDGSCAQLFLVGSSTNGSLTEVDLPANEDYFIRLTVNGGNFDWTFTQSALETGDNCSLAETATVGTNTIPDIPNEWYYYSYTVPEDNKVLSVTSTSDKRVELYKTDCSSGNFIDFEIGNISYDQISTGDVIFIAWRIQGAGNFDWTLELQDPPVGEACANPLEAIELEAGSNSVPVTNLSEYWYSYTIPDVEGVRLFFDGWPIDPLNASNSVDGTIFRGGCSSPTETITVPNGSGLVQTGFDPNETIIIRINLNGFDDFQWTLDARFPGDDCSVPVPANLGINNVPTTNKLNFWFTYTIPANSSGKKLVMSTASNATMRIYFPDCLAASELERGSTSISTSEFNDGDQLYLFFGNLQGGDIDWTLALEDIPAGELCSDPKVAQKGTNSTVNKEVFFSFTAPKSDDYTITSVGYTTVDTNLEVLDACGGTQLATNDNFGDTNQSQVELTLTEGQTVIIHWPAKEITDDFDWFISGALDQTITFDALAAKTFGDAPFELTATASSGLPVSYSSSNQSVATISGNTVTIVGAGTTNITATQEGNGDDIEAAPPVIRELVVNKAAQTITFNELPNKVITDVPFEIGATTSSNLTISYSISDEQVATIADGILTIVGTGTATITASQAGNDNYLAATSVERTLTVSKADQTITITPIPGKLLNAEPFNVEASTTSGLALTYQVAGPASISGTLITLDGTAGTVTVTVSQAGNDTYNAAEAQTTFEVSDDPCTIYSVELLNKTDVACFGETTGEVNFDIFNGTAPFEYTLNNESISLDANTLSNLAAGEYTLLVRDANSCESEISFTITQPTAALSLESIVNESTTVEGDGSISLTVSGGTEPYTYEWSNGGTESQITGLPAGSYDVTVTDANGCTISESFSVTLEACTIFEVAISNQLDVSCFGEASGEVTLEFTNGTAPFDYSLNGETVQVESNTLTNLTAGSYTLLITDANSCERTIEFAISEPESALTVDGIITQSTTEDGFGSVSLFVSGGTPPYTYEWSNGSTESEVSNLSAGEYEVIVTDALGCTVADTYVIDAVTANINKLAEIINIHPNPVSDQLVIDHKSELSGKEALIIDVNGKEIKNFKFNDQVTTVQIDMLGPGKFLIVVPSLKGYIAFIKK